VLGIEEKIAIVTGGGTGLGKATALGLALAGADVAIAGIDLLSVEQTAHEVYKLGRRSLALKVDVADRAQVETITRKTAETLGGIDILVNNAAIYPSRPWEEIEETEWDRVFDVNVKGYFLCAHSVVPQMKRRGRGKIINISSITFFLGFPNLLHYISTKGAVVGFTRALARELGPSGINVNCIAPGAFPTAAEAIQGDQEAYDHRVIEAQCIKRRGKPADVANTVLYLASQLSDFVTGQTLVVDGGWTMH